MIDKFYIDIGHRNQSKYGQNVSGDVFIAKKDIGNRTLGVLADGLGSGIKANVLATLTATMAATFVSEDIDMKKAAQIIMNTLPVCKERKISYCTFSILDAHNNGDVRIIEYDNPQMIIIRNNKIFNIKKDVISVSNLSLGNVKVYFTVFTPLLNDKIIFITDGVTQAGMGSNNFPFGWGLENIKEYVLKILKKDEAMSARNLSKKLVAEALRHDIYKAKDDISCMVTHFREPRKMLIATGPPYHEKKDNELALRIADFKGKKVLCGGTTASIIARELNRTVTTDLSVIDPDIPPPSKMDGVDLITDGALTLSRVAEYLKLEDAERLPNNAATTLFEYLIDADSIHFIVGTKINEAHQDPNLPAELDIRRNLIKRIVRRLQKYQMKEATFELI